MDSSLTNLMHHKSGECQGYIICKSYGCKLNSQSLKLSDFGNTVRYVPLETNEVCLIGNNPHIALAGRQDCDC